MTTRITVTRSPTNGKSSDENDDAENATPIVCSSEEMPSPTLKVVSDRDDDTVGVGVGTAASGNEKESKEDDEQPVTETTTAEASASAAATTEAAAAAASTTTTSETTSTENTPSNPPASETDATAKNNAEVEEEKKDEGEATKNEEIGAAAYKKVRTFMLPLTAEQSRTACDSSQHRDVTHRIAIVIFESGGNE